MKKVRVSMGTLGVLGLELIQMDTAPTTAYLQIYTEERCRANCMFCAQASGSSADMKNIAQGIYIPFDLETIIARLKKAYGRNYLERVCIQTALYDNWWDDTVYLTERIRKESNIPISISAFPLDIEKYKSLKKLGVNELVLPLDACTPEIFEKIKGKSAGGLFSWMSHMEGIQRASSIFRTVGTHLVLGLGENDEDAVRLISDLWEINVNTALFSYIYIPGTQLKIVPITEEQRERIRHYRTVQLARYLIVKKLALYSDMKFENGTLKDFGVDKKVIQDLINDGKAFQTSGCSGCNRPMANERFSNMLNFPRKLSDTEKIKIRYDLGLTQTYK